MASEDLYIRHIDNITILCNVDEEIELPNPVPALLLNGKMELVYIMWENKPIITSEDGSELVMVGKVNGYAFDILCSIQVGKQTDNPQSVYPHCFDVFGLPKRDIQTADIPAIDDYQYFKAKVPRTLAEEYLLKQLRERVADQVILARDINHIRNAITEMQKYGWVLQDQVDELYDKVDDLEDRVEWIEDNMVIDGENLGEGVGVFDRKRRRILEFKTLIGNGVDITDDGDEILFDVKFPDIEGGTACGVNAKAKSFTTCHDKNQLPSTLADGMLSFSEYFNTQMVKIKSDTTIPGAEQYYFSSLICFGMGKYVPVNAGGWDGQGKPPSHGTDSSINAGRFLKANEYMIYEMKVGKDKYSGWMIGVDYNDFYTNENVSRIQAQLYEPIDVYSQDVKASLRAGRYGYNNEDDYGSGQQDGGKDKG